MQRRREVLEGTLYKLKPLSIKRMPYVCLLTRKKKKKKKKKKTGESYPFQGWLAVERLTISSFSLIFVRVI